jgi:hypothetical protein
MNDLLDKLFTGSGGQRRRNQVVHGIHVIVDVILSPKIKLTFKNLNIHRPFIINNEGIEDEAIENPLPRKDPNLRGRACFYDFDEML